MVNFFIMTFFSFMLVHEVKGVSIFDGGLEGGLKIPTDRTSQRSYTNTL